MSLIHEALKKAEQQRHLGEAPTLNSPLFTRRRRRRWLLPLVVLAVLVGGSYLAWSLWPAGALSRHAATRAMPTPSTSATSSRAEQARKKFGTVPPFALAQAPTNTNVDAGAKSPTKRAPALTIVPPPPVHQTVKPVKAVSKHEAATTTSKAAPVSTAAETISSLSKSDGASPTSTPAAPPSQPIQPLPKQPATPAEQNPAVQPAAASTASLPLYWQLPYAERKDLPELNISMHVFAADPADRFVILNGERQIEGDDLGNGMTLDEIRRGGIVVEMHGKRFIVPNAAGP